MRCPCAAARVSDEPDENENSTEPDTTALNEATPVMTTPFTSICCAAKMPRSVAT